jgi:hypothetical protein
VFGALKRQAQPDFAPRRWRQVVDLTPVAATRGYLVAATVRPPAAAAFVDNLFGLATLTLAPNV